jgi:hypothetical protein
MDMTVKWELYFCIICTNITALKTLYYPILPHPRVIWRGIFRRETADCQLYRVQPVGEVSIAFSAHTARRHVEIVHLIKMAMWYSYKPHTGIQATCCILQLALSLHKQNRVRNIDFHVLRSEVLDLVLWKLLLCGMWRREISQLSTGQEEPWTSWNFNFRDFDLSWWPILIPLLPPFAGSYQSGCNHVADIAAV